jgi:hypothetical protein
MKDGGVQLVARRILRAAAYRIKLDGEAKGQVTPEAALAAVPRVVTGRPLLRQFVENHNSAIQEQTHTINPKDFHVPSKGRFREALGGHIDAELDSAERSLKHLEQLEKRLPAWKSYARSVDAPRLEIVSDIHDSQK